MRASRWRGPMRVAPRAGAWIETWRGAARFIPNRPSPPARGRGLKHTSARLEGTARQAAPRAGAWIETVSIAGDALLRGVAPRAGAWIETCRCGARAARSRSPPARGRGLKLQTVKRTLEGFGVAPRAGAWIETTLAARASST